MANPLDIVYSKVNADGTGFNELTLVPVSNSLVAFDACGNLIATGSFSGGGGGTAGTASYAGTASLVEVLITSSTGNYYVPFVSGSGPQPIYIDTSSIYYNPELDLLTVNHISCSDLIGTASFAQTASFADNAGVDVSAYLSSSEFNTWTGSTDSQFAGTASFAANVVPIDLTAYLSSSWTGSTDSQFSGTSSLATLATTVDVQVDSSTADRNVLFVDNIGASVPFVGLGFTFNPASESLNVTRITSSLYGTASQAKSASNAESASFSGTSSFAVTASYISGSILFSGNTSGHFPIWTNNELSPTSSLVYSASVLIVDGGSGSIASNLSGSTITASAILVGTVLPLGSTIGTPDHHFETVYADNLHGTADTASVAPDYTTLVEFNDYVAGVSPAQAAGTYLVDGGNLLWIQDYTYTLTAATYYINGDRYTSSFETFALSGSDPVDDRIDVIAVNNSGSVIILQGTASSEPAKPSVDPYSQLELTFIYVQASTTAPTGSSNVVIYRENAGPPTEWTAVSYAATLNVNSTNNPYSGSKCIEATLTTPTHSFELLTGSGFVPTSTDSLTFYIRSKATWPTRNRCYFALQWYSGSNVWSQGVQVSFQEGRYGFTSANTTSYQPISIPMQDFGIPAGNTIDRLRLMVFGSAGQTIGFYIDDIYIRRGSPTTPTVSGMTQTEADARYLQKTSNLSDVLNVSASRANLGLGNAATRNVGSGSTQVAAGSHGHTSLVLNAGTPLQAPLQFTSGELLSSSQAGVIEFVNDNYYATITTIGGLPSSYQSRYPSPIDGTTVLATTTQTPNDAYLPVNPSGSLTGTLVGNEWLSVQFSIANQRFHIDLGTPYSVKRIYLENSHHFGTSFNSRGVRNFTFWGSNNATAFSTLTYGTDTNWTYLGTGSWNQHALADASDPQYFTLNNNTSSFRYYGFKFADNWGDTNFMAVRRIELQIGLYDNNGDRKGIVLNDGQDFTASYVPYATTNGRLTTSPSMSFDGTVLTVTSSQALSASYAPAPTTASYASTAITASHLTDSGSGKRHIVVSHHQIGTKNILIEPFYSQSLSVVLQPSQSAHVVLTAHGWIPTAGAIIFKGEYFVQYDGLSRQPGLIINEYNNNSGSILITSQIYDPGVSSGSRVFPIKLKNNISVTLDALLTYEVRGLFSDLDGIYPFGAIDGASGSFVVSGDSFSGYDNQSPVMEPLNMGSGFSGPWVLTTGYTGVIVEESFAYQPGTFTGTAALGYSSGYGLSGSWIVS